MNAELQELYQAVLLDHSRHPRNFGELGPEAVHVMGDNPSCGDEIHLSVLVGPDRKLADIKFKGQGCAISQASASMMTSKLKGKSMEEAGEFAAAVGNLLTAECPVEPDLDQLGDVALLQGVRKFPQRVKCAMLAWRALEQALGESQLPE